MATRVAVSTLQASTVDILNVIRENATLEYQSLVPEVTQASDIPKVGEALAGYPAMANQFINALINRIALVRVKSATFNNPYADLKKGYLGFGETIEDIFVNIAKVRRFDPEKANVRELQRTLPDVRSAFHVINWRVQYPITIQEQDLHQAFLSMDGVQDMIARIVDSVYKADEYDQFLLFKYLIIKSVAHGKMYAISAGDGTDLKNAATAFRSMSNQMTFWNSDYNAAGVLNNTPRDRQVIIMDADFNAQFDVDVLSAAFNMDKADFMGRLYLIDSFTKFDNERWAEIRRESTGLEEVSANELALMTNVKAILVDSDWFQVYDNLQKFTETYVGSGMYWNYWLNKWMTISTSPFANAVVFATDTASNAMPTTFEVEVMDKSSAEEAIVLSMAVQSDNAALHSTNANFVQTQAATEAGVAVHRYGAIIFPKGAGSFTLEVDIGGETYMSSTPVTSALAVGGTVTITKQ